jgi:hypothetical protein
VATKSLDRKLAAIHADPHGCREFILADAKDADMAFGIGAPGRSPEAHSGELRFKTLAEYREQIRQIARQGLVDIMLMSSSTSHKLTIEERLFDESQVTPAVRANDTTDVHLARGSSYAAQAAKPFRSADIDQIQCGHLDCQPGERTRGANLGLYSVTFNNDLERDLETLERFHDFRREAESKGFRYFLEVFDPNVPGAVDSALLPDYINDMIVRMLAGVAGRGRPDFLKIVYHGPRALEQLVAYDPHLVVGILGGAAGTTRDAFQLLHDARTHGARVALYGRKINNAENQLAFVHFLRLIADGQIGPVEAVRAYHAVLEKLDIPAHRPLEEDLQQQATAMSYGGSTTHVSVPARDEANGARAGLGRDITPAAPVAARFAAKTSQSVTLSTPSRNGHGRLVTESASHRIVLPESGRVNSSALNGFPHRADGRPDFSRMDVHQRLAYHRQRLGLG